MYSSSHIIKALVLTLVFSGIARAQDQRIDCGRGDFPGACTLAKSQPWSGGNKIFLFRPIQPSVSLYVFVHNNNPTSAHTSQTLSVFQTPSTTVTDLSNNADLWTQDTVSQNATAGASCNNVNAATPTVVGSTSGLGTCFIITSFAAQLAVRITGAASAAGTPDTFDLLVIQAIGEPKGQAAGASAQQVSGVAANGAAPAAGENPVLVGGSDGTNKRTLRTYTFGQLIVGPVQVGTISNTAAAGAANTAVTATLTGVASERWYVYSIQAYCSAGSTSLQIFDGGVVSWSLGTGGVGTLPGAFYTFPTGWAGGSGNTVLVTAGACGAGNTTNLSVQASRLPG